MGLQAGDKIPDFSAVDSDGNVFDSKDVVGKKSVVIYFYPKDNTRICTKQACAFRDQFEDFKVMGAEVVGISSDTVQSHKKFASQYKLPFILLSDADKKLRKLFGVPNGFFGLLPGRVTYVANREGIIQLVFKSLSGKIHIEKALEILKRT